MNKRILLSVVCSLSFLFGFSQPVKKPVKKENTSQQTQMDKAMEEAMKGMSEEEKAEMKKMMGAVMPALTDHNNKTASYPEFTRNAQLVPAKDVAKIRAASAKKLTQAEMSAYAANLYNKIMAKGDAAEIALVKKAIAQSPKANDLGKAAIVCMMQGYPQAAMALSMKVVQTDPANTNWQNNMASLLTQYGYPEQALPVLQKLNNQMPGNSTILNNLAYAWLGLGATDSAKIFAGFAARANPHHPEAKVCGGLIQELNGDPMKAAEAYVEAMENALNPFTEQVMKNNNNGGQQGGKIDFDKVKRTIAIYEYFPKNWIPTSLLEPSINAYVKNDSLQDSYRLMDAKLDEEIQALSDAASRELENVAEKGEEAFVKEMAGEMISGLNFMSRTAVTVMLILHQYGAELMDRQAKESMELAKKVDQHRQAYAKATKNASKCEVYDAAANRLMEAVNPMIFQFYRKQAEDYRQWLNALATWNWYVVGNPKNVVIAQDLGYAAWLESLYISAMTEQLVYSPTCKVLKDIDPVGIPAPAIPNFTCPAIVSIPVGADWQQLSKAAKNFDANSLGAKQNTNYPIPNMSIAYGIGNMVAQPGKAPFIKTANGSMSPGMMGTDDELTPLSKIPDDLTPLPDLRKGRIAKGLLKSMMTADCKNVNKYKYKLPELIFGLGELEFEEVFEVGLGELMMYQDLGKKIADMKKEGDLNVRTYEDGSMAIFSQDGDLVFELSAPLSKLDMAISKEISGGKVTVKSKPDVGSKNGVYTELKDAVKQLSTNGLQPTLSSGLQMPGIFKTIAGLFQ